MSSNRADKILTVSNSAKNDIMRTLNIPKEKIADFCKQNQIRRLYLFGSVLRGDFGSGSDVDVLVEFEPGTRVGLIRLSGLEIELGDIIGRKVDLNSP